MKAGDDFFLTSQAGSECKDGMKMLVKVFCDAGAVTTSRLKLGSGVVRAPNATFAGGARREHKLGGNGTAAAAANGAAAGAGVGAAAAAVMTVASAAFVLLVL